jgi:hypothetical protein
VYHSSDENGRLRGAGRRAATGTLTWSSDGTIEGTLVGVFLRDAAGGLNVMDGVAECVFPHLEWPRRCTSAVEAREEERGNFRVESGFGVTFELAHW